MKRQTSLVVLLTVTALAGGVLSAAPAGATPPTRGTFKIDRTYVDRSTCSFPITVTELGTGSLTRFFDSNGNEVTDRFHEHFTGTFKANGVTLQNDSRHDSVFNIGAGTDTDTGLFFLVKRPGGGVVARGTGRVVFDADGNLIFVHFHPFHHDIGAYCAAFG